MAFDREAAKAEGYTDDEINAYLQAEAKKQRKPAPVQDVGEPPAPTTTVEAVGTSPAAVATGTALAAAPYVGSAALGAGGLYGAKVLKQGFDAMQSANAARAAQAEAALAQAQAQNAASQGIQQRFEARMAQQGGQQAAQALRPVAPGGAPTYNVPTQAVPQVARPVPAISAGPAPVAPQPMAAAAPEAAAAGEASLIDKTTAMIRQLAANKVLGNMVKGGLGAAAALTPGNVGQDYMVPQTGRMKGMEINPLTGRPWTKEQLQAYNANPGAFDAQLGAPQMPR